MILLDLDPNVVKPGWIPLLITVGLGLVMVLLFRSMRRQFRRVDANFPLPGPTTGPDVRVSADVKIAADDAIAPDGGVSTGGPEAGRQGRPIPR